LLASGLDLQQQFHSLDGGDGRLGHRGGDASGEEILGKPYGICGHFRRLLHSYTLTLLGSWRAKEAVLTVRSLISGAGTAVTSQSRSPNHSATLGQHARPLPRNARDFAARLFEKFAGYVTDELRHLKLANCQTKQRVMGNYYSSK
jgi:hypothetical protein